jgi:pimeloyl-ACP methyl ester carboxylesterase
VGLDQVNHIGGDDYRGHARLHIHIENYWEHPGLARWLLRLGSFTRVIMFDKRGTGLSDPLRDTPSLDLRMDDVPSWTPRVVKVRRALVVAPL